MDKALWKPLGNHCPEGFGALPTYHFLRDRGTEHLLQLVEALGFIAPLAGVSEDVTADRPDDERALEDATLAPRGSGDARLDLTCTKILETEMFAGSDDGKLEVIRGCRITLQCPDDTGSFGTGLRDQGAGDASVGDIAGVVDGARDSFWMLFCDGCEVPAELCDLSGIDLEARCGHFMLPFPRASQDA